MAIRFVFQEEIQADWTLLDIVQRCPPAGWNDLFLQARPELEELSRLLETRYSTFYPDRKHLFRAFELTPLEQVKVVLIGMDPYPQAVKIEGKIQPRAQGLAFSVHPEDEIPSSLQNIYKELAQSIPNFTIPDHGCLVSWARQGVLLLNASLTVAPEKPGSHGRIWMGFISKVLEQINEKRPGTIFILLGADAQKLQGLIGGRGIILQTSHPSGLSARRGFLGSRIFAQVNEFLVSHGKTPINWQV